MILMIILGLFTTLLGVVLGGTVLELTMRAVAHSLTPRPVEAKGRMSGRDTASRWPVGA